MYEVANPPSRSDIRNLQARVLEYLCCRRMLGRKKEFDPFYKFMYTKIFKQWLTLCAFSVYAASPLSYIAKCFAPGKIHESRSDIKRKWGK